ncbi:DUF1702 family protein [Lentzea sp. NPDC051213]|uniref:DUF1702 family protein n=1 Tax=Lentzea sp. NPDC051213 TaxID=3364126 RepID=UPI0037B9068F
MHDQDADLGESRRTVALPMAMADFGRRGFRTDRPEARAVLERHARSFLTGFNEALAHWREVHDRLAAFEDAERGFAYEGAAMYARIRDVVTVGRGRAVNRLLSGRGEGYPHLIRVGTGWWRGMIRSRFAPRATGAGLLCWLSEDGAGFAEAYFGGHRVISRRCGARPGPAWQARIAGHGRALWFVESADVQGLHRFITAQPAVAHSQLWCGVGLACAYAGATDTAGRTALLDASGPHASWLRQGVAFGVAARQRAGIVPGHTRDAALELCGAEPAVVAEWTDLAARHLETRTDIHAYLEWKTRLKEIAAQR